jgi:hypothetical protein
LFIANQEESTMCGTCGCCPKKTAKKAAKKKVAKKPAKKK